MASDGHGAGEGGRLRIALVCASNMNRSMEAHNMLLKKGLNVASFGTGNQVRLPGPSIDRPNVYNFGTPYTKIFEDLTNKDPNLYPRVEWLLLKVPRYRQNGLLHMLERNMKIKNAPQRWQEQRNVFDVIITFEERVFDHIIEDFANRGSVSFQPVYLFDLNVKDNQEDALIGAHHTLQLCQLLEKTEDWQDQLDDVIEEFHKRTGRRVLYSVQFY